MCHDIKQLRLRRHTLHPTLKCSVLQIISKHFPNTVGTIQITIKEIEQQKAIYMLQQGEWLSDFDKEIKKLQEK